MTFHNISDILVPILSVLGASGGVLAATLTYRYKIHRTTNEEWRQLYIDTKTQLDKQQEVNQKLQSEINSLRMEITKLNMELMSYKRYEKYTTELELYASELQDVLQPLVSNEAYTSVLGRRPQRYPSIRVPK